MVLDKNGPYFALLMMYFTEFGSFRGSLRNSGCYDAGP